MTALVVARREFRSFFNSPVAYIVLGIFLLATGWLFFSTFFLAGQASLRDFFGWAPFLFVFFIPAITMRLIAEERKSGTLELLLSMPTRDWEVVVGKFLGALGMIVVGLLFTIPYLFAVAALAAPGVSFDWSPAIAGYAGLVLLASSFLAIGLWASALSKNQIVAFIIALLLCFSFYVVDKFAMLFPSSLSEVLQYISVHFHFENISRGVIDGRDLLFYSSLTAAGLFLTVRSLAAVRQ
jgi:ABC-2 type transport system permease protein